MIKSLTKRIKNYFLDEPIKNEIQKEFTRTERGYGFSENLPLDTYESSEVSYSTRMKMIKDPDVREALLLKKMAVLSAGWHIEAGAEDLIEHKDFIEFAFKNMNGSFENVLRQMLSALDHNISITEKVFNIAGTEKLNYIENGDFKGKLIWRCWKTRTTASDDFHFREDPYGNIQSIYQINHEIPKEKVIIYSYIAEDTFWAVGDLESIYPYWWMKQAFWKFLASYIELSSKINLYAKYPQGTDSATLSKVWDMLKNATQGSISMFSDQVNLDSFDVATGAKYDLFEKAIELCGRTIRRGILIPDLVAREGQKVGSYASAQIHQNTFLLILNFIKRSLEEVINEQAVKELIDLNYAERPLFYPKFRFNDIAPDTDAGWILQFLQLFPDFINADWVQNIISKLTQSQFKIPEKKVIQTTITKPEMPAAQQEKQMFDYNINSIQLQDKKNGEGSALGSNEKQKKELEKTEIQALDDLKEIQSWWWDKVKEVIKTKKIIELKKVDEIPKIKIKYVGSFRDRYLKFLKEIFWLGREHQRLDIPQKYKNQYKLQDVVYNDIEIDKWFDLMALKAEDIAGQMKVLYETTIQNMVKRGIMDGKSVNDTMSLLEDILINKGVTEKSDYRLDTILRTFSTENYNAGRVSMINRLNAEAEMDLIDRYEFVAIIDGRTTDICRSLHGKQFEIKDPHLSSLSPPLHWNCRSSIVPIFTEDEYKDIDKSFLEKRYSEISKEFGGLGL